ncbi:MAG: hypothetical protein JSS75_07115 [Bacteroidetes bacterium]|nr:hypothetical protein [Bacteroidota bacterium]
MGSITKRFGETLSGTWQLAAELIVPGSGVNPITGTTAENPAKVTFKYPHQLTTGQNVYLVGIPDNPAVLGNQTITVVDSKTVSLNGVQGIAATGQVGKFYTCIDATSFMVTVDVCQYASKDAESLIAITPDWGTTLDRFRFSYSFDLDSTKLSRGTNYIRIKYVNGLDTKYAYVPFDAQ